MTLAIAYLCGLATLPAIGVGIFAYWYVRDEAEHKKIQRDAQRMWEQSKGKG